MHGNCAAAGPYSDGRLGRHMPRKSDAPGQQPESEGNPRFLWHERGVASRGRAHFIEGRPCDMRMAASCLLRGRWERARRHARLPTCDHVEFWRSAQHRAGTQRPGATRRWHWEPAVRGGLGSGRKPLRAGCPQPAQLRRAPVPFSESSLPSTRQFTLLHGLCALKRTRLSRQCVSFRFVAPARWAKSAESWPANSARRRHCSNSVSSSWAGMATSSALGARILVGLGLALFVLTGYSAMTCKAGSGRGCLPGAPVGPRTRAGTPKPLPPAPQAEPLHGRSV